MNREELKDRIEVIMWSENDAGIDKSTQIINLCMNHAIDAVENEENSNPACYWNDMIRVGFGESIRAIRKAFKDET